MPQAKLRLVARFHSGDAQQKSLPIDPPGGNPEKHLTLAFRPFRAGFSLIERTVDVLATDAVSCHGAAEDVLKSLTGMFSLESADLFAGNVHYWNGERWVKVPSGSFGYGFLILKGNTVYQEKTSLLVNGSELALKVDYVLSVRDPNLQGA